MCAGEGGGVKRKGMSRLESIHATFKKSKSGLHRSWLKSGIVVKVLSLALKAHGYYKQKGVIKRLIDPFIAELEMIESHDIIRVDQAELETVLPAIGGKVRILKGIHEDAVAEVTSLDVEQFSVEVAMLSGSRIGRKEWYTYEDVSKIYNQQH